MQGFRIVTIAAALRRVKPDETKKKAGISLVSVSNENRLTVVRSLNPGHILMMHFLNTRYLDPGRANCQARYSGTALSFF